MNQEPEAGRGRGLEPISQVIGRLHPNDIEKALSAGELEPEVFECSICRDSHTVHPRKPDGKPDYQRVIPCRCVVGKLARERAENLLRYCELPAGTGHMTFETFRVVTGLEEAFNLAQQMAEGADEVTWLTFMGDAGRGKTHLLISICRRWLARGVPAKYVYVPLLLEELRRGFREEGDRSYEARFDRFLNVPLLAMDDLGTEYRTKWVQEKLDTIVDYRVMNNLRTVVTTNKPLDELPFRIGSRLRRLPGSHVVYVEAPEYVTDNS